MIERWHPPGLRFGVARWAFLAVAWGVVGAWALGVAVVVMMRTLGRVVGMVVRGQ